VHADPEAAAAGGFKTPILKLGMMNLLYNMRRLV
jgi:hypothetical protein